MNRMSDPNGEKGRPKTPASPKLSISRVSFSPKVEGHVTLSFLLTFIVTLVTYLLFDDFGSWVSCKLRGSKVEETQTGEG